MKNLKLPVMHMKRKIYKNATKASGILVLFLIVFTTILSSCKKESETPSITNKIEYDTSYVVYIKYNLILAHTEMLNSLSAQSFSEYGHCWDNYPNPDITNNHTNLGYQGADSFESFIQITSDSSDCYIRPYIIIKDSIIYGPNINYGSSFGACEGIKKISYKDQTYNIVEIGLQCWMAENLNVGQRIDGNKEMLNNQIIEKYCYNDNESKCNVYGGLYQWDEMMHYTTHEGSKGICPDGWHIPSIIEWKVLTDFLGGENVAGGKMKEPGTNHWISPNTGATNSNGFSARPGGHRSLDGSYYYLSRNGSWWSSTDDNSDSAMTLYLDYYYERVFFYNDERSYGYSVRCLKNNAGK